MQNDEEISLDGNVLKMVVLITIEVFNEKKREEFILQYSAAT